MKIKIGVSTLEKLAIGFFLGPIGWIAVAWILKNEKTDILRQNMLLSYPTSGDLIDALRKTLKELDGQLTPFRKIRIRKQILKLRKMEDQSEYEKYIDRMVNGHVISYIWPIIFPFVGAIAMKISKEKARGLSTEQIRRKYIGFSRYYDFIYDNERIIMNKNFSIIKNISFSVDGKIFNFAQVNEQVKKVVDGFPYKKDYLTSYPEHKLKYSEWLKQNHPDSFERKAEDPKAFKIANAALAKDVKTMMKLAEAKNKNPSVWSKIKKALTSDQAKMFYGIAGTTALIALKLYLRYEHYKVTHDIKSNSNLVKTLIDTDLNNIDNESKRRNLVGRKSVVKLNINDLTEKLSNPDKYPNYQTDHIRNLLEEYKQELVDIDKNLESLKM